VDARLSTGKTNKKDRVCTRPLIVISNSNQQELKLFQLCRYCFGGALVAGLLAGFGTGFTGVLPAAGAGTPDWVL
jgi:ribosomal protein S14